MDMFAQIVGNGLVCLSDCLIDLNLSHTDTCRVKLIRLSGCPGCTTVSFSLGCQFPPLCGSLYLPFSLISYSNEIYCEMALRKHVRALQIVTVVEMTAFRSFFFCIFFFLFLLKSRIVGTRYNRLTEADLTSAHNLCFISKNKKITYTPTNPSFPI